MCDCSFGSLRGAAQMVLIVDKSFEASPVASLNRTQTLIMSTEGLRLYLQCVQLECLDIFSLYGFNE